MPTCAGIRRDRIWRVTSKTQRVDHAGSNFHTSTASFDCGLLIQIHCCPIGSPDGRTIFERLRNEIGLGVAHFTAEHATAAQRAYLQYGKGRHPAALNFGDCMTYAAAQIGHEPMLAVGNDFPQTRGCDQ